MIPRKRRKKEQGYDPNPPVCRNCKHFQRAEWRTVDGQRYYTPQKCVFGGFIVEPFGICDEWAGKRRKRSGTASGFCECF